MTLEHDFLRASEFGCLELKRGLEIFERTSNEDGTLPKHFSSGSVGWICWLFLFLKNHAFPG